VILNQAQAEAVYSAMCALNNVGSIWLLNIETPEFSAKEEATTGIKLRDADGGIERHADQAAFATAYGLQ
jgi:hypothetical protein